MVVFNAELLCLVLPAPEEYGRTGIASFQKQVIPILGGGTGGAAVHNVLNRVLLVQ